MQRGDATCGPEPGYEYADALVDGLGRGRGAGLNPGNRFESVRLHVLGEHWDAIAQEARDERAASGSPALDAGSSAHDAPSANAPQQRQATTVLPDQTRSVINPIDTESSADIGFRWSVNPYRGCEHGCIYCYARPGHEYLGMSSGLDFETKLLAKHDAPQQLRRELSKPGWRGETIMMAGVTDCYQPIERELRITRGCLAVMAEARQPVSIVTKHRLILRDLDLLVELAAHQAVTVAVSVTTLEAGLSRRMEPRASSPADRLHTIAKLREAGVPVTVMAAPIIPGLTDRELPGMLKAAADAGAQGAGYVMLRLPHQIKALFLDWLAREAPGRAGRIESLIRQTRGGKLYDARTGIRMRGQGPIAEQIGAIFKTFTRKYGLNTKRAALCSDHFRRPTLDGQMTLF